MRSVFHGLIVSTFAACFGLGCQNKMYSENQDLRNQNLELQQQLDEANRRTAVATVAPTAPAVPAAAVTPRYVEPAPQPAPAPAPVAPAPRPDLGGLEVTHDAVAGTTTVNLPSDIFFSPGQAVLQADAKKSLSKVASALKKEFAGKPIRIEGNTDSDPIVKSHWKSNQELSEKRAEAVRDYLVSKGISGSRITTEGLGDTNPKSKKDKSANRRVELVVMTR